MPESSQDSHVVYRAFIKKKCFDPNTKNVLPAAFYKRPKNDAKCLSVAPSEEEARKPFGDTYGVAAIEISALKELSLELDWTSPDHANIKGVPRSHEIKQKDQADDWAQNQAVSLIYDTKESADADFLAIQLAKAAKLISDKVQTREK